ncbi:MAG: PD-(D/E)XK motif protein [Bacteroidia bacterium]
MDRIKEIWRKLESNPAGVSGIEKIRFSESSPCDLYLGIKTPENSRLFAIRISLKNAKNVIGLRNIKGMRIEKILDNRNEGFILLNLILSDNQYQDIFDVLISDIISHVVDLADEKEIIKNFYNRLNKWQALFEKFNPEGLSAESQRGLFGELVLLKKLISEFPDKSKAVQSWVGSALAIQDFQMDKWAIEVKTTSGNNHQKIHISNERQLDETIVANLFLFHLSLDIRQGNGELLNTIIDSVRDTLKNESVAYTLFCHKLIEAGYFDIHKDLYTETGYTIRETNYYKVEGKFPRLKEKDIPTGVGDVKYTVNISDCGGFVIPESDVFKLIF